MWNTTEMVDQQWMVSTSCMDIDIVGRGGLAMSETMRMPYPGQQEASGSLLPLEHSMSSVVAIPFTSASVSKYSTTPAVISFSAEQSSGPSISSLTKFASPASSETTSTSGALASGPAPQNIIASSAASSTSISEEGSSRISSSMRVTSTTPLPSIISTPSAPSTQMVRVDLGEVTSFTPQSLDASTGDTIWFYTLNGTYGSFLLYNTTLEEPCLSLSRFGDDAYQYVLLQVNDTEPMWFLGRQPNEEWFHCYPPAHFALNAGSQRDQFLDKIQDSTVITVTTTTIARPT
ncbi:hypothetical protein BDV59DRAFT_188917 [Aspergillus ambiguus]|uniref:uncharacterized protein n=1 Tax=Aspergillus ambiguus TaxID=176160 RepID=UPI003CCCF61B